jgi:hypothetical protein
MSRFVRRIVFFLWGFGAGSLVLNLSRPVHPVTVVVGLLLGGTSLILLVTAPGLEDD